MLGFKLLPLDDEKENSIYYNNLLIRKNKIELEKLLNNYEYTFNELFPFRNCNNKKEKINTYKAYKYILENKKIDKKTLNELYTIISEELLDEEEELHGKYYRDNDVYIFNSRYDFDKAMPKDYIEEKMNKLFEYSNDENSNSKIEEFIKSQIIHFYFVYIHPYNDMNGRTARTTSMWYLLNNNINDYILFNRGIIRHKEDYLKAIRTGRHTKDITNYLNFILKSTILELQRKELKNKVYYK